MTLTALAPLTPADPALDRIVHSIADSLRAQVSSIYQWRPETGELALVATHGLNPELVGQLRLTTDQGLTGLVAETRRPVSVKHPDRHPRYIHVPGSFEERLQSYLGVPVFHVGRVFAGVLTVQSESARIFLPREITAVVQAASEVARLLAR